MMGTQAEQDSLFTYEVNLSKRVRADHPLRAIRELVDFSFVRQEVAGCYGSKGNVSVDPVVVLKMMFLLFYDNIPSERELMAVIPERLDYLWFLGYDLDDVIPNHSVLSKARKRWGAEAFESFFVRVLRQCVEHALVGGSKLHLDSSLTTANASKNSVVRGAPALIEALKQVLRDETNKLDDQDPPREEGERDGGGTNATLVSRTDPDAPIVRRPWLEARARYKVHRAVDDRYGVVTANLVTPGTAADGAQAVALVKRHEAHTEMRVETCVADSHYGTIDNYRAFQAMGIACHMADHQKTQAPPRRNAVFAPEAFVYEADSDTYRCPAGQTLYRHHYDSKRRRIAYQTRKGVCAGCPLRDRCTKAAAGRPRQVKRYEDQEHIDAARRQTQSRGAKRDRIRRKYLMEGSFADATNNHGFKRCRWRRLANQRIQYALIAAVQNIRILMHHLQSGRRAAVAAHSAIAAIQRALIVLPKCIRAPHGSHNTPNPSTSSFPWLNTTQAPRAIQGIP